MAVPTMKVRGLDEVLGGCPGVRWSAVVQDATTGQVISEHRPDDVVSTASVGKVLLLIEVARQFASGRVSEDEVLGRDRVEPVADSGLWQHLAVDRLAIGDVCLLVGAVSDNLATNVLLDRIGVGAVAETATALGLRVTALHDLVRDVRGPGHPERLSTGTAAELAGLFGRLHRDDVVDPNVSSRVRDWLTVGADLSMAVSALNLDPLSHAVPDRGVTLVHKTGTDAGVRADVGLVSGPSGAVSYAVVANWDAAVDLRDQVLRRMREVGEGIADLVTASEG